MSKRFIDTQIEQLVVGKMYTDKEGRDFIYKCMRNDYLATFEKVMYAEEDEFCENPINSHEEYYFTESECCLEGWISK